MDDSNILIALAAVGAFYLVIYATRRRAFSVRYALGLGVGWAVLTIGRVAQLFADGEPRRATFNLALGLIAAVALGAGMKAMLDRRMRAKALTARTPPSAR